MKTTQQQTTTTDAYLGSQNQKRAEYSIKFIDVAWLACWLAEVWFALFGAYHGMLWLLCVCVHESQMKKKDSTLIKYSHSFRTWNMGMCMNKYSVAEAQLCCFLSVAAFRTHAH